MPNEGEALILATAGDNLRESMRLYLQARSKRRQNDSTWRVDLRNSASLRVEAHNLDPKHESPAWEEEQGHTPRGRDTHEEIMAFYREQGVL